MKNLRVKLAFSEYWLLSVYGMQGKYHFSSDIRNFISHITYYSFMFSIAYAFKGQVHMFSGRVKIVSHTICRTSAILKYFCPLYLCACKKIIKVFGFKKYGLLKSFEQL